MEAMVNYSWPGNVRELQNFIERAVILAEDGVLRISTLECKSMSPSAESGAGTLFDVQRERIVEVLEETNWVISGSRGAAAVLGLPRTTLISKMQKLGIARCAPHRSAAQQRPQIM
jgi:formate hydrogenlyase transcriptional activator